MGQQYCNQSYTYRLMLGLVLWHGCSNVFVLCIVNTSELRYMWSLFCASISGVVTEILYRAVELKQCRDILASAPPPTN
jgi:hypothetical protein